MADDFLSVKIVGEKALLRNFDQLPEVARGIILQKLESLTAQLEDEVIASIERTTGSKTGKLVAAVRREVREEGAGIEGKVYVDEAAAPYARILDKGGVTQPHVIYPRNGKVLAFLGVTGEKVFATRVFHPGGQITPRYFMKDARRSVGPAITRGIKNAVVQGIRAHMRTGR